MITERLGEVRALCARHGVKSLAIFGSAAKGTFDPERSDLDFVVEFLPDPDPLRRGENYLDLLVALERLFDRRIDLVVGTTVENPYFKHVLELTARELYDAA
ncbi:MAG TPA: nucleotidyltransferase domain-containing protein [Thermoanaerobaculia bacterium]|nr:nucleotidyltransferase domain-containing protein [Thermoanaerobaculia bacterium]